MLVGCPGPDTDVENTEAPMQNGEILCSTSDCPLLEECIQGLCSVASENNTDGNPTAALMTAPTAVLMAAPTAALMAAPTAALMAAPMVVLMVAPGMEVLMVAPMEVPRVPTRRSLRRRQQVSPGAILGLLTWRLMEVWLLLEHRYGLVSILLLLANETFIDQVVLNCGDYPIKSFSLQVSRQRNLSVDWRIRDGGQR